MKFGEYNSWELDQGVVDNVEVSINNALTLSTLSGSYEYTALNPLKITATSEYSRFYSAGNLSGSSAITKLSWRSWFSNKKPSNSQPQEIFYEYSENVITNRVRFFYCDNFQMRQPKNYSIWYSQDGVNWLPVQNMTNGFTTDSGVVLEQSFNSSGNPSTIINNSVIDNQNNALSGGSPLWITHCFDTVEAKYFKLSITESGGGETYISDEVFSEFVGISKLFFYSTQISLSGSKKYNQFGSFTSPIMLLPRVRGISYKASVPQQTNLKLTYRICKKFEDIENSNWLEVKSNNTSVLINLADVEYPDWKFQYRVELTTTDENFSPHVLSLEIKEVEKLIVSTFLSSGRISGLRESIKSVADELSVNLVSKKDRLKKETRLRKNTFYKDQVFKPSSVFTSQKINRNDLFYKQKIKNKNIFVKSKINVGENSKSNIFESNNIDKKELIKNKKVQENRKLAGFKLESAVNKKVKSIKKAGKTSASALRGSKESLIQGISQSKESLISDINVSAISLIKNTKTADLISLKSVEKAMLESIIGISKIRQDNIIGLTKALKKDMTSSIKNEKLDINSVKSPDNRMAIGVNDAFRYFNINEASLSRDININETKIIKNINIKKASSVKEFDINALNLSKNFDIRRLIVGSSLNIKNMMKTEKADSSSIKKMALNFKISKNEKFDAFKVRLTDKRVVKSQGAVRTSVEGLVKNLRDGSNFTTGISRVSEAFDISRKPGVSEAFDISRKPGVSEAFDISRKPGVSEVYNLEAKDILNIFNFDRIKLKNNVFDLSPQKTKTSSSNISMSRVLNDFIVKKSKIIKTKSLNTSPKFISKSFYIKPKLDEYINDPYIDIANVMAVQGYTRELESPSRSEGGLEAVLRYPYLPETWDGISHIGLLTQHDRTDVKTFNDNVSVVWEPIKQDTVITEKWSGMDYNFFYQLWLFYSMQKRCKYRPKDLNNHQYLIEIIGIEKGEQNRFWVKDVTLKMKVLAQIENWGSAESISRIPNILPKEIGPEPDNLVE